MDGLLFYSKNLNFNGDLKVVILSLVKNAVLSELHGNALLGHRLNKITGGN